jgi:MFS family permease
MITQRHVHVKKVWGIPQFWLIWMVLCMNVSAGIGVIGMASPMLQEVFGGSADRREPRSSANSTRPSSAPIAGVAAGFTALLSLFNIGGRFFWASLSDKLGRKMTYVVFFVLGGVLYASMPGSAAAGSKLLFVGAVCIILSMYGGGFATVPAYLADIFGTQMVGAIHGRLLTAWATAGILGPVVVNYMREYQLGLGMPREQVYNQTMYILVGMLVIGLICNLLVRPLAEVVHDGQPSSPKKNAWRTKKPWPPKLHRANGGNGSTVSPAVVMLAWARSGHSARMGRLPHLAKRRQVLPIKPKQTTRASNR